jgi:hypothetical protein
MNITTATTMSYNLIPKLKINALGFLFELDLSTVTSGV